MPASLSSKGLLDTIATSLTSLFSALVEAVFGPGAGAAAFGAVTWADLGAVGLLLVLTLLAHGASAAFLRHKARRAESASKEAGQHHVFGALGRPLYVLIWIYSAYLVAAPLLGKLPASSALEAAKALLFRLVDLGAFAVVVWLFYRLTRVIEARLAGLAGKSDSRLDDIFVPLVGRSLRVLVPVVGIILALPLLSLAPEYAGVVRQGTSILLIVAAALVAGQAVSLGEKAVLAKYDIHAADNLQARKVYTQVHVISKTLYVVIGLFAVASVLMLFEEVRRFGTSLLASAGVVGIIIGFAAQKTIANLFAGFQVAMTQPIRLDDVVIVENEWGRIEEITLTYVVVRIWDDRRLVVPLSTFIEKPFQNWTRTSAELLGSVFVWADYSLPLDEVRAALKEIIEPHPLWDKRFWNLQVTETSEKTMQIRVLATSADSSKSWDLRCDIREQLIGYIQKHHPNSLPRLRAEVGGDPSGARGLVGAAAGT